MSKFNNNDENYSDNDENSIDEKIKELTIDDFLNNVETKSILETNFFEKFEKDLQKMIECFYKEEADFCHRNYLNLFDKDYDLREGFSLFLIIYDNIVKNYDLKIFHDYPYLAKSVLSEDKNKKNVKKIPKIIHNAKLFDWNTKKYK